MSHRAFGAFATIVIVVATASLVDKKILFANGYEQSQTISQTNECGNYWFPLDVLCSNINSQIQGDENSMSVTSAAEDGNVESNGPLGAPFP
jgi:uncharacterized OB-fold protein